MILVLILLALGALLITPALNLAFTGLTSRMAEQGRLMEYYAADGAQEYSLWLLNDPQFVADLIASGEPTSDLYIILNDIKADYSISYQASAGAPSDAPLTSDRYRITVDVDPDGVDPDYLPPDTSQVFIYSITLQYMYPDIPTEPLEELEVILPLGFSYMLGSSIGTDDIEPDISGGQPNKPYTLTWDFTSQPISFDFWEERAMSFQATATPAEGAYYTEAEVSTSFPQPRGETGPTAPIIVGSPPETGVPRLSMSKTVSPEVIPPGVPTLLTYTITLKNLSSVDPIEVQYLQDALPAGFAYAGADTGFLLLDTSGEPDGSIWPGTTRQLWEWRFTPIGLLTVNPLETLIATFQAIGTVDSSGTYANEVFIKAPGADTSDEYSWPTGGVIVPQFDIESNSGDTTLHVVTEVSGGSHNIKSWHVE